MQNKNVALKLEHFFLLLKVVFFYALEDFFWRNKKRDLLKHQLECICYEKNFFTKTPVHLLLKKYICTHKNKFSIILNQ